MSDKHVVAAQYHVEDEGNSALGWVCVTAIILGFAIGTLGLFFAHDITVYVGAGIAVLAALAWPILKAAGLGPKAE